MKFYTAEQIKDFYQHTFAYIKVREDGHRLTVTLARPAAKNAMSPTMVREYGYALAYAHYSPHIWAVVFEAEGNVWCAGADLKTMRGQEEANNSTVPIPLTEIVIGELFWQVHKPVICAVHAPVYAGGFLLLGGATYVIASQEATFGLPEVRRGIFPFQVMAMLLQNLPARTVLDWCIRARTLTATEAHAAGLVSHLVSTADEISATVDSLCTEIFQNSPSAIRLGLQAYDEMRSVAAAQTQVFLKAMLERTIQTTDAQEGLRAFAEKRVPQWIGE